jgi:Na+-transporting NADH:ubiquinone oxidoreductase subunit NqrB
MTHAPALPPARLPLVSAARRDPRLMQLAALCCLLVYTQGADVFRIAPNVLLAIFGLGLAVQYLCCAAVRVRFDPVSCLITCCSLCLLLRTESVGAGAGAVAIAVSSKFLLRFRGRHVFNPTNLALAVSPFLFAAWLSPGQWGTDAFLAAGLASMGAVITGSVRRFDMSLTFLAGYAAFLFGRAFYYGDPAAIPLHAMQNAGLALFAFFMLSDPVTTPKARTARMLFGAATLGATLLLQFYFFVPAAFIYGLLASTAVYTLLRALPFSAENGAITPNREPPYAA